MPKGPRKPDPLRIQVSMSVKRPRGFVVSRELMETAFKRWMDTGRTPKGFTVNAVIWQNPKRKDPLLTRWRTVPRFDNAIARRMADTPLDVRSGSLAEVRETLNRDGRLLREVAFQPLR